MVTKYEYKPETKSDHSQSLYDIHVVITYRKAAPRDNFICLQDSSSEQEKFKHKDHAWLEVTPRWQYWEHTLVQLQTER